MQIVSKINFFKIYITVHNYAMLIEDNNYLRIILL